MKKLSSQDRKSLIRLASSLDKGSEERRAILAALKFPGVNNMTLRGGPPANEVVTVHVSVDGMGPRVPDFKVKAGQLQDVNNVIDAIWAYGGGSPDFRGNQFKRAADLEEEISNLQDELSELKRTLFPIINAMKKLGIKLSLADLKKLDGDSIMFDITDSSGQKWFPDGGEEWMKE